MVSKTITMTLAVWATLAGMASGQDKGRVPEKPDPTHANVAYGKHERNVLDFWQAKSGEPTPLAVFIHGGGFAGGSKENLTVRDLKELLDAGISVAALNYRYVQQAKLPAAHEDCARAVQFLRSKAEEWNLDKTRFGGFGGSAGAQLVMYLAFHDDLCDPKSDDPVVRESTRLACVAPGAGQVSMDMAWWDKNVPDFVSRSTNRLKTVAQWNAKWYGTDDEATARKAIADISAISLISKDDPPVFMSYGMAPESASPADATAANNWITHHVAHGVALKKLCDRLGVECHLQYPGAEVSYPNAVTFLKAKLARAATDGKTPAASRTRSPVRLQGVELGAVRWTGGLWKERCDHLRDKLIPGTIDDVCLQDDNGANFRNFLRAAGADKTPAKKVVCWSDGDCYYILEAISRAYAVTKDPALDEKLDYWIGIVAKVQQADGYVGSRESLGAVEKWAPFSCADYNMGHLLQAAIAHKRATGKDTFLAVAGRGACRRGRRA
ncbi:MAG: glycoside hydrolase family 127 protein [Planctomycetes bacterium]|nr:glycoside hydrolase family 127 protein [Planctomycetota bacterium]